MRISATERIATLYEQLDADSRALVKPLVARLDALGCKPRRLRVKGYVLAFVHPQSGRTLAKIGAREGDGTVAIHIRFSALEGYPEPFARSLRRAFDGHKVYQRSDCRACGNCAVPRTYRHIDADGESLPRCGAYTIALSDPAPGDVPALLDAIEAQYRFDVESLGEGHA